MATHIISDIENAHSYVNVSSGDTFAHTTSAAGPYVVECNLDIPLASPANVISIVINQGGSPVLTVSGAPSNQGHMNARMALNCSASQVINAVVTVTTASARELNNIKAIVNIRQGQI